MFEFSPKEFAILLLLVQGKSNKEIAELQPAGCRTVETHVHNVLGRTCCNSRCELIVLYFNNKEKFVVKTKLTTKHEMLVSLFAATGGELSVSAAAKRTGASLGYARSVFKKLRTAKLHKSEIEKIKKLCAARSV
jgi:DNA-binding CsgD family transcriptional regulator